MRALAKFFASQHQLNELKISTQKQLNSLNETLGKIKDKMNKFKSFILFKGLDRDFKEYEQEKESIVVEFATLGRT